MDAAPPRLATAWSCPSPSSSSHPCRLLPGAPRVRPNLDGSRKKKWVAWAVAAAIFVVLMLITPAIPQNEAYHDFTEQRPLFLGIPNTLNVISHIPFFFVGIMGLILCHYKNYFRLRSQGGNGVGHQSLLASLPLDLVLPITISTQMVPH